MARHALRLAHDLPDLVERAGQILRADDDHRDDDDHQKFRRIDAKHACLPPRPKENQALVFSSVAVGASCSGTRWPSMRVAGLVGTSSSSLPFLKPLMPLATSPISPEMRPPPNSRSDARRVGKAGVSTCVSRWGP